VGRTGRERSVSLGDVLEKTILLRLEGMGALSKDVLLVVLGHHGIVMHNLGILKHDLFLFCASRKRTQIERLQRQRLSGFRIGDEKRRHDPVQIFDDIFIPNAVIVRTISAEGDAAEQDLVVVVTEALVDGDSRVRGKCDFRHAEGAVESLSQDSGEVFEIHGAEGLDRLQLAESNGFVEIVATSLEFVDDVLGRGILLDENDLLGDFLLESLFPDTLHVRFDRGGGSFQHLRGFSWEVLLAADDDDDDDAAAAAEDEENATDGE